MLANISISKYMYHMLTDDRMEERKEEFLAKCPKSKIVLLFRILCDTEISDTELLRARIYEFGSLVKDDDHWGRDIFLCLVAFLNLVIK